jgi:hypothetical protein
MTGDSQVMIFAPHCAVFNEGPQAFDHFKQVVKSLSRADTCAVQGDLTRVLLQLFGISLIIEDGEMASEGLLPAGPISESVRY